MSIRSISKIPFLIRGLLDWMIEAGYTPYLIVNAQADGVAVPQAFVQPDGTITLNISGDAVRDFHFEADHLYFSSRFQGQAHAIAVPLEAILGLVTRETSDGLWFAGQSALAKGLGDDNDAAKPKKVEGEVPMPRVVKPKLSIVDNINKD